MDAEEEIVVKRFHLPGIRENLREYVDKGFPWLAWGTYNRFLQENMMFGFAGRAKAVEYCWNPTESPLVFKAAQVEEFSRKLEDARGIYNKMGGIPESFTIKMPCTGHTAPENSVRQERYDRIKRQVESLGVASNFVLEQIKTGVLTDRERLSLTMDVKEGQHPLRVELGFKKNGMENFVLENLEVNGILVPRLVINGVSLDDLQERMNRIRLDWQEPDASDLAVRQKVWEDLEKISRDPRGKAYAEAILVKYKDGAYPNDPDYARDLRRENHETTLVFPWKEEEPMTIREACQLFIGQAGDRKGFEVIHKKENSTNREASLRQGLGRARGR